MSSFRRAFSSTARSLLEFVWKGTKPIPEYEENIKTQVGKNYKLDGVDRIEIAGGEHDSAADPDMRVSGQIFKGHRRVTSVHAYKDGRVVYSKELFNESQG
ncbi:TPA_exp: hypothetical protein A8136_5042 [Trichophyton benhamiae CBS 112371]|nr:TPA_exp: hypothetical protein A8136_5042 [Trichophyton benhamiae CBS 112371]